MALIGFQPLPLEKKLLMELNTDLQIFQKENLELRTVNIDGEPWFVLADIAKVLDIQNTSQLADQLRDSQRAIYNIRREISGNSEAIIINESGLYRLLLRSKKPQAETFQIWVEDEVLPTIRKTGKYEVDRYLPSYQIENAVKRAERWIVEYREKEALQALNEKLRPKAETLDLIENKEGLHSIRNTAKLLQFPEKKFIEFCLERKILFRDSRNQLIGFAEKINNNICYLKTVNLHEKVLTQTLFTNYGISWLSQYILKTKKQK